MDKGSGYDMYGDRPVLRAATNKQLAKETDRLGQKTEPPYVVKLPDGARAVKCGAFHDNDDIDVVILPDSVFLIGHYAFKDCTSLETINIPASVRSIGNDAFSGCESLTCVSIPDSVVEIGEDAFSGCDSLEEIHIKNPALLEGSGIDEEVKIITE